MTYKEVQCRAAPILRVKPTSVKTCWIAEIKRNLGIPVGRAWNSGQGRGAPLCPDRYKPVIRAILQGQRELLPPG